MIEFIVGAITGMAIMGIVLLIYIGVWEVVNNAKESIKIPVENEPVEVRLKLKQRIVIIDEMRKKGTDS